MPNFSIKQNLINFSSLPDTECAMIIQNNLLEALANDDLYFEWEVIAKISSIPFELRYNICDLFKLSLKRNSQKIGQYTIGQWTAIYLSRYENIERSFDTFLKFVLANPATKKLSSLDQVNLMRILRMYDYLFITPFFDLDDLSVSSIIAFAIHPNLTLNEIQKKLYETLNDTPTEKKNENILKLSLKQAVDTYPKIGEQTITSQNIKLKNFGRPVRASIKNWLYDYAAHLGQGPHDPMERTNYLFRSENTKNLSSQEREKLSIILKSFDENIPLAIDTANQEMVFEGLATHNSPPVTRNAAPEIKAQSFVKPYQQIGEMRASRPQPRTGAELDAGQVRRAAPETMPPLFVKPARPIAKPVVQPPKFPQIDHSFKPEISKPIQQAAANRVPSPTPHIQSTAPDNLQFYNPYPTPEKHEVKFEQIPASPRYIQKSASAPSSGTPQIPPAVRQNYSAPNQSPIKVKGFSEKQNVEAQRAAATKKPAYAPPNHPKNIFYPHNYHEEKGKNPEVIIDGNIVDLSRDQRN